MSSVSNTAILAPFNSIRSKTDEINHLKILYELSMTLPGDPVEIFSQVAPMVGELLDVKVVCLSEVKEDQLNFISVYANGEVYKDLGSCFLLTTPCSTIEKSSDYRIYENVIGKLPEASFLKGYGTYSYCGLPSFSKQQVVAVICLLDDRPHEFTDEDQDMLRIFGQRIGMEIERQNQILEKEKVAKELESYRQYLEDLVASRTKELESFSYAASHDLRTPIRHIKSFSDILLEEKKSNLDEESVRILHRINHAGKLMNELLDGLLRLSTVARSSLVKALFDLSTMTRDVITRYQEAEPSRNVLVDIQCDVKVIADKTLIQSVMENLLGNAWKYTSKMLSPCIQFRAQEKGNIIVYSIIDNGVGFDQKYVGQLFEPFKRLHSESEFQGTGIGLATVKRIIEYHGGAVWASCESGKTTFSFTLD